MLQRSQVTKIGKTFSIWKAIRKLWMKEFSTTIFFWGGGRGGFQWFENDRDKTSAPLKKQIFAYKVNLLKLGKFFLKLYRKIRYSTQSLWNQHFPQVGKTEKKYKAPSLKQIQFWTKKTKQCKSCYNYRHKFALKIFFLNSKFYLVKYDLKIILKM